MRSIGFIVVGLTTFVAVDNHLSAMPIPSETIIAKGIILNVDEKNSSFDVLRTDGGRSTHLTPKPVLMVIKNADCLPYHATWDDIRHISVSGRITSIVVDPGDPSLIIFDLSSR